MFFETREWEGKFTNREPEKCDDMRWFPVHDLPADMMPFARHAITHALAGNYYSEYTDSGEHE
jgi:8-oxo-dGTP diphosphatase